MIATSFGRTMEPGDEIITTEIEHHSNFIPWHLQRKYNGAVLKFLKIDNEHQIDIEDIESLISERTKVIAITHLSNTTGQTIDIKKVCDIAHKHGIIVVVDGTQSCLLYTSDAADE